MSNIAPESAPGKFRIFPQRFRKRPEDCGCCLRLAKHLARHGVEVILDTVDAAGRGIGEVLDSYVASRNADLLVMGAYWAFADSRIHFGRCDQEHAFTAATTDLVFPLSWRLAPDRRSGPRVFARLSS